MTTPTRSGPLVGLRVVHAASIGPGPFGTMILGDLGADVIRIDRTEPGGGQVLGPERNVLGRSCRSIALDLKTPGGLDAALRLVAGSDVFVEGYRPGVAERLGLGPDECRERNRGLVYARMTGWGREGPRADRAGHDINYVGLAGALHPIGPPDRPPTVPLTYVGDFGGGGMLLALGILAALYERARSGQGQVVDVAMVDGAALQTAVFHGMLATGLWSDERGTNFLDGAAPYYGTYRCADGRFVAVGAIEPQFYAELLDRLGLDPDAWPQDDRSRWPEQRRRLADLFAQRPRDEWARVFDGSDACVTPVLSLREAGDHPQLLARETFVDVDAVRQPAPAPRFSRTPGGVAAAPPAPGAHTQDVLRDAAFSEEEIAGLERSGAARQERSR